MQYCCSPRDVAGLSQTLFCVTFQQACPGTRSTRALWALLGK